MTACVDVLARAFHDDARDEATSAAGTLERAVHRQPDRLRDEHDVQHGQRQQRHVSAIYLGLVGVLRLSKARLQESASQLFWAITNLLDKDPPVAPGGNAFPTNPVFFDTIGARVRAGVRLNF